MNTMENRRQIETLAGLAALVLVSVLFLGGYYWYKQYREQETASALKAEQAQKELERKSKPRLEFVEYSKDGNSYSIYLPADITKNTPSIRSAWLLIEYKDKTSMKYKKYFDCENKMESMVEYIRYDMAGNIVDGGPFSNQWANVIPDTLGSDIFYKACE
ncbi:hypothetical protein G6658_03550 [Polynucleobacter paneuropaeus]|nr:hypothetical protein G6658_03550 [Polynucleobacter paneuropaeus]